VYIVVDDAFYVPQTELSSSNSNSTPPTLVQSPVQEEVIKAEPTVEDLYGPGKAYPDPNVAGGSIS
jgi:hypothetical protein